MPELLVTIIVPVFNGQEFISRCLDSIRRLNSKDWECLVVNDGSTDDSAKLISEYVEKDGRFRQIQTPNGGVSKARNLGIREASGQWICFIDVDDWISPDYFDFLESDSADQYDLILFNSCHNNEESICSFGQNKVVCGETSIRNLLSDNMHEDIFRSPWGKVIKADFIKTHHLQFIEQLNYGEDTIFNLDVFFSCKSLYCCDKGLYHYYVPAKHVSAYKKYGLSAEQIIIFLNNFGQRYFSMGIKNVKCERLVLWNFISLEKLCDIHTWKGRRSYYHNIYQTRLEKRVLKTFGFYQRFCYRFCSITPDFMQWVRKILVSRY